MTSIGFKGEQTADGFTCYREEKYLSQRWYDLSPQADGGECSALSVETQNYKKADLMHQAITQAVQYSEGHPRAFYFYV